MSQINYDTFIYIIRIFLIEFLKYFYKNRSIDRQAEKKYLRPSKSHKNFESSRRFEIPQRSQIESIYEEVSFRENKCEKINQKQINTFSYNQITPQEKNNKKENINQRNLYLNEYDLNQDNMLFSNDIHKKNLSNRSIQSHKSSSQSIKPQQAIANQSKYQKQQRNKQDYQQQQNQDECNKYIPYLNQHQRQQKIYKQQNEEGMRLVNMSNLSNQSENQQEERKEFKQ